MSTLATRPLDIRLMNMSTLVLLLVLPRSKTETRYH